MALSITGSRNASAFPLPVGVVTTSGVGDGPNSHGSQLLSAGVPLPAISKRLGHSSVYVTATVYSHALPKDEAAAGDAWENAVKSKIS